MPKLDVPRIVADDVHIWRASLDVSEDCVESSLQLLSEDEKRRADCFIFPRDRRRFVMGRATLRILAGSYLSIDPAAVLFQYSPNGKPYLPFGNGLQFNVSHTHEYAVYGFSLRRPIGIDIELLRPERDALRIARSFFAEDETRALEHLPGHLLARAFLICWTRKEAYIKALGDGLSMSLSSFVVSVDPDDTSLVHPESKTRWQIVNVDVGRRYVGSLVIEAGFTNLICRTVDRWW